MKFRKKPVEVEAIQFLGNFAELEQFVGGDAEFRDGQLVIATLEGSMHASPNDWIIRGVQGEFYPCKPDIFQATYQSAEIEDPYKAAVERTVRKMEKYIAHGASGINPNQIIGLLSLTWPDGNYSN